ncbi:MAG: hypothetical protein KF689_14385, partial [Gemmatimonadaceae bacterium]|nr:hypothetical protein [Gemmatimonadaceae bacterium]
PRYADHPPSVQLTVMRTLILAALCVSVSAACSKKQTVVEGSVFIVTRGGDNYKLGLVEIGAYADTTVERIFGARSAEAAAAYPALRARFDSLALVAERRQAAASAAFDRSMANILSETLESRWRRAQDESTLAIAAMVAGSAAVDSLSAAPFYFADLPSPIATAKSDADGRFSMTVPRQRIVLVGVASRNVMGDIERYYWAVRLDSLPQDTVRVMLSNDNLFATRCRSCMPGFIPDVQR